MIILIVQEVNFDVQVYKRQLNQLMTRSDSEYFISHHLSLTDLSMHL